MNQEENILKMIIEKQSWEEVLYQIVSIENINPWDVDLVKLTGSFMEYIKKLEILDFRVPAKIVFVSAVLLRLKADYLSIFEEEEETIQEIAQRPPVDLGIDPNLIQLGLPMRRIPKRQVTLDELVFALKKALNVRVKRDIRRRIWKERLQANIEGEDITKKIEHVMKEINDLMEKLKKDKLEFKQVVDKWNRDQVVDHLIPLLHLEQNKKIKTEQEEFFKEIYISVRKIQDEKSNSE